MDIHVHHHFDPTPPDHRIDEVLRQMNVLINEVHTLHQRIDHMSAEMDAVISDLAARVERNTTVETSFLEAWEGLRQALKDALSGITDPVAIQRLNDLGASMDSNTDRMASAMIANTSGGGGTDTTGGGGGVDTTGGGVDTTGGGTVDPNALPAATR